MTLNEILRALADELAADGLPDPLHQPLTLGLVWYDLAASPASSPRPMCWPWWMRPPATGCRSPRSGAGCRRSPS